MKRGRLNEAGAAGYFAGNPAGRKKYYGVKRMIDFQRKFPLSQYSYSPIQRGSEQSLAAYGPSWKLATPAQREMRKAYMMTGRGNFFLDKFKELDNHVKTQYEQAVPNPVARYVLDKIGGSAVNWTLRKLLGKGLYRGRGGFFGGLLGSLIPGVGYDQGSKWGDVAYNAIGKVGDALNPIGRSMMGGGLYKGRGAYATNNLVTDGGATASNVVPVFKPTDLHTVTYSNREYVKDVFAPAAGTIFSIDTWALNPGLVTSFPWLSQLAINFEEYEIVQLAYTYKSTVADFASASGQVGQIVMATQYNPNSDPFADKEEMMLYEGGMSCKTTESLIHGIECDPSKIAGSSQKYVRAGSLPPTEDLKNYDLGKTSLAVLNVPSTYASQQIGELWVSYTVMLRKPKIASGNAYNIRRDVFAAPSVAVVASGFIATDATLRIGSRNSLNSQIVQGTGTNTPTTGTDDLMVAATSSGGPVANGTTTPYQFKLTLPADYSGCLRIRVLMTCSSSNAQIFKIVSAAPNTIKRFRDIPDTNTSHNGNIWTHVLSTYDYDSPAGILYRSDTQVDIRVLPPAQGQPNELYFTTTASLAAATYSWSLEVSQLNTFLSVADNGKNDAIDFVTANGASAIWA